MLTNITAIEHDVDLQIAGMNADGVPLANVLKKA